MERGTDEYLGVCTTDETIDLYGKPAVREKTGGWKAVSLVLVTEGLATIAYTGVEVNMLVFLKSVLRQSNANAAKTFSTWIGTLEMCTLLGAFLSDSYLGRYLTCAVCQAVLVIGLLLLSLSTQEFMLQPKGCGTINDICNPPSAPKVAIFYVSIFLIALGSGAVQPALATLGVDQFDEGDPKESKSKNSFFTYYYVALNIGSLLAVTVLVYIENLGKWVFAFWVSTLCGFLALIFLLSGTCQYRRTRLSGNPVSRFCQVIIACVWKLGVDVPLRGEGLYEVQGQDDQDSARRLSHTDDFKILDKAAVMTESEEILLSIKGQTPNPWRLCTATQVEEVKCVLRLLPIWFCAIVTSIVFTQVLSLFVEQGSTMNTKISSSFRVAPASMTTFDIISTSTFIIFYEKIIVPFYVKLTKKEPRALSELQRMGIGMVIAIIGMIVAGLVEQFRLKYAEEGEMSSLSIFWQVPQYVLVGVSEAFIYVAQWELFTSQVPKGLKSIGLGMSMSSSALGSFLCSIILTVVMKITSKHGKSGWISPNLNKGHMDRFFFLSAALIAFDLVLFVACANRFKRIGQQEKRDERNEFQVLTLMK